MSTAYFPYLGVSAQMGKMLSIASGLKLDAYDFDFNLGPVAEIDSNVLKRPVLEAVKNGADHLIGHSLGGYALTLSASEIRNKKILLIDGGFENPAADIKSLSLDDLRQLFKSESEKSLHLRDQLMDDSTEAFGYDYSSALKQNFRQMESESVLLSREQSWPELVQFVARQDWTSLMRTLCAQNDVTVLYEAKILNAGANYKMMNSGGVQLHSVEAHHVLGLAWLCREWVEKKG